MRRNRHKHVRKALRFYKINHGFKVPFKVLVDGNFVNALLELKRGEVQDLVPQFLGEKCRVFTTRCCVNELRKLGLTGAPRLALSGSMYLAGAPRPAEPSCAAIAHYCTASLSDSHLCMNGTRRRHADATRATKMLAIHHCGHDTATPSSDCLLQQVSTDNNASHFFVATQDRTLQRKVSNVPGGAVLFATVNGIQMEMPSEKQKKQMMKTAEERQLHMGEMERRMLQNGGQGGHGGHEARDGGVRRKKAKGPNPLSMKKKKTAYEGSHERPSGDGREEQTKAKRKRQRKSRETATH